VDARRSFQGLPKGLPASLRDLIEPLLAFDPNDRPSSLEEHFGLTSGLPAAPVAEPAPSRVGLWLGGIAAAATTGALVVWLGLSGGSSLQAGAPLPVPETAEATEPAGDGGGVAVPVETPEATEVAEVVPQNTRPREPTAQEKAALIRRQLQIDSLLRSGATAVRENRLTRPLGESALDKYRRVLELDPNNAAALEGLTTVSGRLIDMSSAALRRGDVDRARDLFEKAEATTPDHPGLAELRPRFERDG
jgi:hypothetical protein